ncbi:hypothetical protein N7478_003422 [Penicillium angulare]|uniref:uncharacterized protein n=1 Tax=Penicillium angulare TaxID=116970 RepID=UPI00254129A3|nr:uncharacterized protein N7478_003422 [Penicillium angulare]KAJ5287736.1 hypothetical protein N7478_003422 [Penicillium angulare]
MSTSQSTLVPRSSADGRESDEMSASKRRKVRKGTRSCWECRQRKMKCIFSRSTDIICVRCHRRGIKCVSQEYPEEITSSLDRSLQVSDRLIRVENLVEKLLNRDSIEVSSGVEEDKHDTPTSPLLNSGTSPKATSSESLEKPETAGFEILSGNTESSSSRVVQNAPFRPDKHEKLSRTLHASLPSPEEIQIIVKACGNTSSLFYQMQIVPYNDLDKTMSLESMFATPNLNAHPVIIARHMLHVATALQHLHPDFTKNVGRLSEPPREMMRRLSAIATNIVTTNDDLVYCVEGIECMLVESWFHTNGGNIRKGLVTVRRAMTIAELMGFHQPGRAQCKIVDQQTKSYPDFIWHRITALERYLCLTLGIPEATNDHSMTSQAALSNDTPMGRLDRIHSVVTSKILQRNQSLPASHDPALAQYLDEELQAASRYLPDKWWLVPNLATVADKPEALFWDMRRLLHHLFHYNLLIQLHLPYMLGSAAAGHRCGYSQIICVNSARDILSRFVMFHSFNRIAFSCRTVDFFGLMAAMTLLLVHTDGHQQKPSIVNSLEWPQGTSEPMSNPFTHQRPSDRALIENMLDILDEVGRLETETMSTQISNILRRLMTIEAEAAKGPPWSSEINKNSSPKNDSDAVQMSIPHFGVINVTRRGIFFKNPHQIQQVVTGDMESQFEVAKYGTQKQYGYGLSSSGRQGIYSEAGGGIGRHQTKDKLQAKTNPPPQSQPSSLSHGHISTNNPSFQMGQANHTNPDSIPQQNQEFPLTAGEHMETGQDAELQFFDTLMRGIRVDENDSIDWLAWLNVS